MSVIIQKLKGLSYNPLLLPSHKAVHPRRAFRMRNRMRQAVLWINGPADSYDAHFRKNFQRLQIFASFHTKKSTKSIHLRNLLFVDSSNLSPRYLLHYMFFLAPKNSYTYWFLPYFSGTVYSELTARLSPRLQSSVRPWTKFKLTTIMLHVFL